MINPNEISKFMQDPESVSSITHLGANFMPLPLGAGIDTIASLLDEKVIKGNIVQLWGKEIARKIGVKQSDLQGDEGLALVSSHIEELPAWMQKEWTEAEDVVGKTEKFGLTNIAAWTAMGGVGGIVGGPSGLLAGGAAGILANKLSEDAFKEFTGRKDTLITTQLVTALHALAEKEQLENAKHSEHEHVALPAVKADKTLVGTLLITMYPEQFEDVDQKALLGMLPDHIQQKEEEITKGKTGKKTELEETMMGIEDRFVSFLPENIQGKFSMGTTTLDIVASQIHSQDDLTLLLFEPQQFKALIAERVSLQGRSHPCPVAQQQEVHSAGKALHHAMQEPVSTDGAALPAYTSRKHDGPSRN